MHEEKGAWTAGTVTSAQIASGPYRRDSLTGFHRTTKDNIEDPNGYDFHGYHVPNPTVTYDGGKIALLDIAHMNVVDLMLEKEFLTQSIARAREEWKNGAHYWVINPTPRGCIVKSLVDWFVARYKTICAELQARHDELQARHDE